MKPLGPPPVILQGDVLAVLRTMKDHSVDCVVTSPPYWGLRDYGVAGQIGLEPTLGEHIAKLVEVFREIWRVLKPHGTVWLNYGDCYAAAPNGKAAAEYKADGSDDRSFRDKPFSTVGPIYDANYFRGPRTDPKRGVLGRYDPAFATARGAFNGTQVNGSGHGTLRVDHGGRIVAGGYLKPKDLCMISNRLAIALQEDGWWVRSEIIWHKPNPMPESVYDRPTQAHEKVWLLTKSEDYFYDYLAIQEPVSPNTHARVSQKNHANQKGSTRANGGTRPDRPMKAIGPNSRMNVDRVPLSRKADRGRSTYGRHTLGTAQPPIEQRNPVPVNWNTGPGSHGKIAHKTSKPQPGAPSGWNSGRKPGVTPKSAAENTNIKAKASFHATTTGLVGMRNARNVWTIAPKAFKEAHFATFPPDLARRCVLAGTPKTVCSSCGAVSGCGPICEYLGRVPGHVLDPFGGAGTVALVARRLGLRSTIIELNPEYVAIAEARLAADLQPKPEKRRKANVLGDDGGSEASGESSGRGNGFAVAAKEGGGDLRFDPDRSLLAAESG